jgi:hypothetical protein
VGSFRKLLKYIHTVSKIDGRQANIFTDKCDALDNGRVCERMAVGVMKSEPITNKFLVSFESLPPLSKVVVMVMIVW